MNYCISIVDDNSSDAEYIASLVKRWAQTGGHAVKLSEFSSAEAFLFGYEDEQNVDILLLDIEMGDMDGVTLAKKLRQTNTLVQIVFVTGFPDFIAEGYDVCALHYLMKPVSYEKLYAVLCRAADNLAKAEKRMRVAYDHMTEYVPLSKIFYIEAQKQYIHIHTADKTYRMKKSLMETEKELDEYFYRCQRSFLVNLCHVAQIKSDCVVLKNGEEVPISRGMAEKIGKEIIRLF